MEGVEELERKVWGRERDEKRKGKVKREEWLR
jgi:hypothetical protein